MRKKELLRSLFYDLLRDASPAADIEHAVRTLEGTQVTGFHVYSNQYLAGYAEELAIRVLAVLQKHAQPDSCGNEKPPENPEEKEEEQVNHKFIVQLYGQRAKSNENRWHALLICARDSGAAQEIAQRLIRVSPNQSGSIEVSTAIPACVLTVEEARAADGVDVLVHDNWGKAYVPEFWLKKYRAHLKRIREKCPRNEL